MHSTYDQPAARTDGGLTVPRPVVGVMAELSVTGSMGSAPLGIPAVPQGILEVAVNVSCVSFLSPPSLGKLLSIIYYK